MYNCCDIDEINITISLMSLISDLSSDDTEALQFFSEKTEKQTKVVNGTVIVYCNQ